MPDHSYPAHALSELKEMARVGYLHFRREAIDDAALLQLTQHDIVACIQALKESDFHKSMDAENPKWAGCRQDVYRTHFCGEFIYVKLQLWPNNRLYVVSFKRK